MTVLELKKISKQFKGPSNLHLFQNIDLIVQPTEKIAITGDSGVGKSTLLHIIGLLEQPSSGELIYLDQSFNNNSHELIRKKHLGFIFQGFYLLEEETAIENILMPARVNRQPTHSKSDAYQRALELLGDVNLLERAHFPAKLLSGGEKQRVAIARALCNNPEIILADEPTGNLDETHSKMIQDLLFSCCKKHNKSLILVTHDHSFADLCDSKYQLINQTLVKQ